MAFSRWIWFIILLLATYFVLAPWLGLSGSFWVTIAFALALALTLDYFGIFRVFPFRLKKNIALILLIGLWGFTAYSAGWLSGFIPGIPGQLAGQVSPITPPTVQPTAGCVVSEELKGKTSTLDVNAWDLESNTPYSSAVDFGSNCWIYKNGNGPENYIGATTDTSDAEISGFTVGDTIYMYCGGSTYYGEPVEGVCVESQRQPLSINAHTIVGESDMQVTAYDDTGSTTLSAGDTGDADYKMTQGAGGEDAIYIKLKVNVANKAYQVCAWGVAELTNITDVTPQDVESTYTQVFTPTHMESIAIVTNSTTTKTQTKDYTIYKFASPILLHEWDSIKEQFVVEASDTNDPLGFVTGTNDDAGFAIIAKDCAYARGDDGRAHLDFYQHDTSEGDVGLDETETSPAGKQVGVLIEVE